LCFSSFFNHSRDRKMAAQGQVLQEQKPAPVPQESLQNAELS